MDCAPHAERPVLPHAVGFEELCGLLSELGDEVNDTATDAKHVGRRWVIFLGDLVDRGPPSPAVPGLVTGMVPSGHAAAVSNIGCSPVVSGV
jgi:hypothetical protein